MRAAPEKVVGGALMLVGLLAFAALAWVSRKLMLLERALDAGDAAVMAVLVLFGACCVGLAWILLRAPENSASAPAAERLTEATQTRRITLSQACAAAGVLLLILSVLVPAAWYPVGLLFAGLALLAVSHALTPCVERLAQLRRARDSMRQL